MIMSQNPNVLKMITSSLMKGKKMMFFGLIFLVFGGLIILVLVIGVVAYFSGRGPDFIKQRSNDAPSTKVEDSSLYILQERYARGEIDEEEYQKMKRNLKS